MLQLPGKRVFGVRRTRANAHELLLMRRQGNCNVELLALRRIRAVELIRRLSSAYEFPRSWPGCHGC